MAKCNRGRKAREVVSEGSKGTAFFLLLAGSVDVIRGKRIIARLNEGDFFGEIALMSDAPRNASVTASSDGTAFTLSRTGLAGALKADPKPRHETARRNGRPPGGALATQSLENGPVAAYERV